MDIQTGCLLNRCCADKVLTGGEGRIIVRFRTVPRCPNLTSLMLCTWRFFAAALQYLVTTVGDAKQDQLGAMMDDPELLYLIGQLSDEESDDPIAHAYQTLDKLDNLPDDLVAALCCSKEGIAKFKERLTLEDPSLRSLFIARLGRVIVRVWVIVNSEGFDIEGHVRVSSRTEARRMVDDFQDMAIDTMKTFALGALGRAPATEASQTLADNLPCCSSYCEVLAHLLNQYTAVLEPLDHWVDALSGVSGSSSLSVHTAADVASKNASISLLPLIKPALMVAFKDRYQLIQRCRQLPTYSHGALRLVSAFMCTLLTDLSPTASLLTVLVSAEHDSGAGQSLFNAGTGDVADSTAAGAVAVPVVQYVSEWVESFLMNVLQNDMCGGGMQGTMHTGQLGQELSAVIRDAICLTQHTAMASLRHKVRMVYVLYHAKREQCRAGSLLPLLRCLPRPSSLFYT
jgi:hypothetical protein